MKKLDRPVVVLLTVVMFAVSAALIALVFALVNQGKARPQPADVGSVAAAQDQPAEKPAEPAAATPSPKVTPRLPTPRPTPRRTRRPATPVKEPEQAVAPAEGGPEDTSAVTLDGNAGRVSVQINPGTTPGSAPLAAMAKIRSMSLTEGQRAAIEQFETAFQQEVDTRLEYQRNAMERAAEELQQAYASGNKSLISQGQSQLRAAAKTQAGDIQQLNRKYLDGIRQYLDDDQVLTVEKTINHSNQAWGYATLLSGDDAPKVTIIQPQIPAEPPDAPPEENAEQPPDAP